MIIIMHVTSLRISPAQFYFSFSGPPHDPLVNRVIVLLLAGESLQETRHELQMPKSNSHSGRNMVHV